VPGRVGVDPERFVRVVRAVAEDPGAQAERPAVLARRLLDGRDSQVQVQHLRVAAVRPGRLRQLVDLLERHLDTRPAEHEPVLVRLPAGRRLDPRPVPNPSSLR